MLKIFKKFKKIIVVFVIFLFIGMLLTLGKVYDKKELEYGVTFSKKHSESLGLSWKDNFTAILDDLNVKKLRLSAYWNEVEYKNNLFNYKDLDWLIAEAKKRDAKIILAIGARLPRWPECHIPSWANNLEKNEREKEILEYIEKTINRYKGNSTIYAWQIENEPFLIDFGKCPKFDVKFLDKEINLVKKLDSRPIVITDSGELSLWVQAAKRADIFGTSMYLKTFSSRLNRYIHYPITPKFFHFKRNLTKLFVGHKKFIVIELQAEPWGPIAYQKMSEEEREITMDINKFRTIIDFSHKSGFKTFYFWGAEWWYWEKEVQKNPTFWKEAKKIFNSEF